MENKFNKIKTIDEAMKYVKDGCTIMIAGFGGIGSSYDLIQAIIKKGVKDLTQASVCTCTRALPSFLFGEWTRRNQR